MARPRQPANIPIEIGSSGLKHSGGWITEEYHRKLKGEAGMRIFEEMSLNDAVVGAALYAIEAFLRRVEWNMEPADQTPEAKAEAEWMRTVLSDMEQPFDDVVSEMLSFLVYGFALHEQIYKIRGGPDATDPKFHSRYSDGRIALRALAPRAQTSILRWDIDEATGRVKGAYQTDYNRSATAEIYLPLDRCLHIKTKSKRGNPEGVSVLRNAYRSWYFKKRIEEIEAIGASRDLTGIPVVRVPAAIMASNASDAQRAVRTRMEQLVSQIARDEREGMVFPASTDQEGRPTGFDVSLLSSPGGKQITTDPIVRRYDSRIAMSVLADFLMLGTEKTGSFAMASEKSTNFNKSLEFYVSTIATAFNRQVIDRLYDMNGIDPDLRPRLVPSNVAEPNIGELGAFLQQVAGLGFVKPTAKTENALRSILDLPPNDPDETDAVPQPNGPPAGSPKAPGSQAADMASSVQPDVPE